MAYVVADPEMMTAAASDLASIGSNISAAHMAAAARTVAVIPAGADEVSAAAAHLFSQFGRDYQAAAADAVGVGQQFELLLAAAATSYANAEYDIIRGLRAGLIGVVDDAGLFLMGSTYPTRQEGLLPELANGFVDVQTSSPLSKVFPWYLPLLPVDLALSPLLLFLLLAYVAESPGGLVLDFPPGTFFG